MPGGVGVQSNRQVHEQRSRRASYTNVGSGGCDAKFGNWCDRRYGTANRNTCEGYCSAATGCAGYGWRQYTGMGHCFLFGNEDYGEFGVCGASGMACNRKKSASAWPA